MQIRKKIVLIFMLVIAVTLLLLSLFVYLFSLQSTQKFFNTRLKVRASIALHVYLDEGKSDVMMEMRNKHLQFLPEEEEHIVLFDSASKTWSKNLLPANSEAFYLETVKTGYAEYEDNFHHYVGVSDPKTPEVIVVATAYDEEGMEQMKSLGNLLLIGFMLALVLVFAFGRLLANQILKPIAKIVNEVTAINASNLDKRLTISENKDEITILAHTFNSLLDRLHTAFQLQSNFISNASHELRTPLTTILGESDYVLSADRSSETYKESITTIRDEAEKLKDLVTSLLELSRVDFDGKRQLLEPINIDLMLMKIKAQISKYFPVNHLQVEISEVPENPDALVLMCIPSWIELAFMNIIHNAIKYSDNKREVKVSLSATDEALTITITDTGIGISEADMKYIFELFFRGSNSLHYSGHGIGLPLADKIIRLHGGTISINSQHKKGTTVTVRFAGNRIKK